MQPGYFCAAGVDPETGKHVRPVLRRGRLTIDLLSTNGGPFDVGSVLDLGSTTGTGRAPELEDHRFDPADVRWHESADRLKMKLSSLGVPFESDLETEAGGHSFTYASHMAERAVTR